MRLGEATRVRLPVNLGRDSDSSRLSPNRQPTETGHRERSRVACPASDGHDEPPASLVKIIVRSRSLRVLGRRAKGARDLEWFRVLGSKVLGPLPVLGDTVMIE